MALAAPALWFTFVSHVLAAVSIVLVLVWNIHFRGGLAFEAANKNLIFNLHPVFMLIGFIIIGGEAVISYKAFPFRKEVKKVIHLVLHAIALVLGAIGIHFAFKYHNESGIVNLYSLHSWLGLGAICLYGIQVNSLADFMVLRYREIQCGMSESVQLGFGIYLGANEGIQLPTYKLTTLLMTAIFKRQWVIGFVVFFFPGAPTSVRGNVLPWHVLFGLFVYVLAVATAELGFLEKLTFLENSGLYKYGPEAYLVNFLGIIVVFFGAFVVLTAVSPAHPDNSYDYASISEN